MSAPFTARARAAEAGATELLSPGVGIWRDAPRPGALVRPGGALGFLEVLGVKHALVAPEDAFGLVAASSARTSARVPVTYGDVLLTLEPLAGASEAALTPAAAASSKTGGLVFVSPMSGRFYRRPSPDKPDFVSVGDTIEAGHTLCLLEVMKTFNRVTYGGAGLPAKARVKAIVPRDGDDIAEGSPILELEP